MALPALTEYLVSLFAADLSPAIRLVEEAAVTGGDEVRSMLRLALHRPASSLLLWLKLQNVWARLGKPMLKPNPVDKSLLLLTDFTAEGLAPAIALSAAAYGVRLAVELPPFDSVEQTVLGFPSAMGGKRFDVVALVLSEEWLRRHLGSSGLVTRGRLHATRDRLFQLVSALRESSGADVLVASFPGPVWAPIAGGVRGADRLGWSLAVAHLNAALAELPVPRVFVVDTADAIFGAGGRSALGRASFLRARMAYEPSGAIAVAKALAAAVANLSGKSHRALLTDLDNTLWGGEVAEVGAGSIVCGPDSPDGLAFSRFQERLKALKGHGVLLGAVSRNDPGVVDALAKNRELALAPDDFATLQLSYGPKSEGVARATAELGFGVEFMVLVDDSLFELAEVLRAHPHIDVLLAGPDPLLTLDRMSESRFFDAVQLLDEDTLRGERAARLRQQREQSRSFASLAEYLKEIGIGLRASRLNDANADRVVQLLQKSNQFNLTTRRHQKSQLEAITQRGGQVWAFAYDDAFGPQGIISVVVLVPEGPAIRIDSWVMSCRVLNRGVEAAVFGHIVGVAAGRRLIGTYVPTDKNGLVKGLYRELGFEPHDAGGSAGEWTWSPSPDRPLPVHFVTLVEELA